MAYAKTTPLQVALQLGIGLGVGIICYKSFVIQDPVLTPPKPAENPAAADQQQLQALEAEAQKTTAQVWGIQTGNKPSPKAS